MKNIIKKKIVDNNASLRNCIGTEKIRGSSVLQARATPTVLITPLAINHYFKIGK